MMRMQRELVIAVAIVVLSQWIGLVWLAGQSSPRPAVGNSESMERALTEMRSQLLRIETLQATKVATVNPEANTVTMDQSILQNTLREIVADELNRISPSLSAEYTNTPRGTAYVGETTHMEPEQAYSRSSAIIAEAIQVGEWDARHTAEMAPLVNNLTQEQRIELLEQYHGALNRGEIKMTGLVPPL
jgi:hypothetical protein